PNYSRNPPPEALLDLRILLDDLRTDKGKLSVRVLNKICQRLDLAVRVHRDADRSVEESCEVCDRPSRMILADQSNSIAVLDALGLKPMSDRSHVRKRLAERVILRGVADDPHRRLIGSRFE